jgi:Ca2+-binding RTX toxin-like protein
MASYRSMAMALVLAAVAAVVVSGPASAGAAVAPSCSFDGHTVTATYGDPGVFGITASLRQVPSNGGQLVFDQDGAVDCGATIHTAAKIVVNGTPTLDYFAVDESQSDFSGQLPPINARLAGGNDVLIGKGTPNQVNTLVFGSRAMVINGTVVMYSPIARGELQGGNEDGDLLSGQGGGAAGGVFGRVLVAVAGKGSATIEGGNGPDVLRGDTDARGDMITGGKSGDAIQGSESDDQISGGPGGDDVSGGAGDDVIFGNGGDDFIMGDSGQDRLMGGSGSDELHTQDGVKDVVRGGLGPDIGLVDCGIDRVAGVENTIC